MPNFSSLARLEVPEKFLWWVVGGGVCKVIFMSNPTVVLRLGWGFDNFENLWVGGGGGGLNIHLISNVSS